MAEDVASNELPEFDEKQPSAASAADFDSPAEEPALKGRQQLLERLQATLDNLTDLEQLEEAVRTVEKLQSDRAGRQPALIRQLAFYFSDANLRRDWFLRKEIGASEGGYVKISVILPFKRLHLMGCSTAAEIVAAIEAADPKFNLELSDARDAVRRTGGAALPPPSFGGPGSDFEKRAVQLTGFTPGDESVGIESMTGLCANFGPVFFVKLHRERTPDVNGENPFNGTVQVEFESEEAAVAIVAMEHHLMWKDQKIQACRLCDVRRKREEQASENQQQESKGTEEARAARKRRLEEDAEEAARYEERGLVLRFDDIPASVSWRDLKEGLSPYGRVRFVRFCAEEDKRFALVQMKDEEGIFAILGCAKEDEGFLCVQCWPSGHAPEGRKRKRRRVETEKAQGPEALPATAEAEGQGPPLPDEAQGPEALPATAEAEGQGPPLPDEDKPLAESVAANPEAKEEDEEDLPLEELARSEGSGEAETKDCEAESAEPVAEGAGMELDAEDDDSSVEQSVTVRLPVTRVGGEEEEEFLKKAAISQMESARIQEKGKGKGHGKGYGKYHKGGKDGKGKSKDGKGKSGKGGKAGRGKGSRKGGKH